MVRRSNAVWQWLVIGLSVCLAPLPAYALQSTNYQFSEDVISTGNMLQSSSLNYQAMDGVNDLAVGNAASSSYQIEAGSKTTPDPWLAVTVNGGAADFGTFSPSTTATATATFSVLNYTSYGYIVQIFGNPPTNNATHTLNSILSGGPNPGAEGFGINLVANTSPISFGANPDNGLFGFGEAAPNYATPNFYRYNSGDTIASAPKSSGLTNYTISAIVDVSTLTPGGTYSSAQTLIVTGTY